MKNNYFREPNYIHYSNCHEDVLQLKKYMPSHTKRVLSIASALDNSLAFLENEDIKVFAIDSNPSQVYLSKLKIAAIKHLSYHEFLIFLGFQEGDSLEIYQVLQNTLDEETKRYFDEHLFLIENKLIRAGRFEYYFHLFQKKILPLIASKKKIEKFMSFTSIEAQRRYYNKHINNYRFKLLFRIFFSKKIMAKLGRDKAYFQYTKGSLAKLLKERVDLGIYHNLNALNPYLQCAMLGRFKEFPYYAKEEVFEKIKKNIANIEVKCIDFVTAIQNEGNFDFMNLSDIFEYMPKDLSHLENLILASCNSNARIVYWNMMNPRYLQGLTRINTKEDLKEDRAMYYQDYIVYEVHHD
ncbi:MAG: BtaA family protein [Roseburia sp.]|nr:BtaA family protein [Anaeroplasma bactoclasticum]MCM1195549.1 BtaA family protein [Roseburia sp.]MCM1555964.1 BtaA family protein [Anaeroplasma bactoclasticum]